MLALNVTRWEDVTDIYIFQVFCFGLPDNLSKLLQQILSPPKQDQLPQNVTWNM